MTTTAQSTPLADQPEQAVREQLSQWQDRYNSLDGGNLKLDLSRGKPGIEQVSLSDSLDGILQGNYIAADGTDTRNYGGTRGIPEAVNFALIMGVPVEHAIAAGIRA